MENIERVKLLQQSIEDEKQEKINDINNVLEKYKNIKDFCATYEIVVEKEKPDFNTIDTVGLSAVLGLFLACPASFMVYSTSESVIIFGYFLFFMYVVYLASLAKDFINRNKIEYKKETRLLYPYSAHPPDLIKIGLTPEKIEEICEKRLVEMETALIKQSSYQMIEKLYE